MSAGDPVKVDAFDVPRKQFELALITLELEFVKAKGPGAPAEEVDAPDLVKQLQRRFGMQARASMLHLGHPEGRGAAALPRRSRACA